MMLAVVVWVAAVNCGQFVDDAVSADVAAAVLLAVTVLIATLADVVL